MKFIFAVAAVRPHEGWGSTCAVAIRMSTTLGNKSQRHEFDWHSGRILNLVVTSVERTSGRSVANKMDVTLLLPFFYYLFSYDI